MADAAESTVPPNPPVERSLRRQSVRPATAPAGSPSPKTGKAADAAARCQPGAVTGVLSIALPPLSWVPQYTTDKLPRDLVAGLVMGVMFVPMGLAYASLIGIPLHIGLYSSAVYSGFYALVGSTAMLSMGPVAEVSLMLLGTPNMPDDPDERARVCQAISLGVGIMSLLLVFVKGGVIIRNGFARAVGNAYATAAGIILITVQLKDIVNVPAKSSVLLHEAVENLIRGLGEAQFPETVYCMLFTCTFLVYLFGVKKIKKIPSWIPHQLVAVAIGIVVAWQARLDERIGLFIVRDVPTAFPEVGVPDIDWSDNSVLMPIVIQAAVITLIAFLQMYSIATRLSSEVHANRELFASAICAAASGLLGGIPGSSSFSRCSVLADLKASTPLNSLVAALLVVISAVGLTRLGVFYYLPKGVLAAIIIASVIKLVNFSHALWLARVFPIDFLVWIVTFLGTLFLGVAPGILSGIALSIVIVLIRIARPPSSTLGYSAERREWLPLTEDAELLLHREVHVWSFDAPCYFVNVSYLTALLEASMTAEMRTIKVVVLHCGRITDIDASSVESVAVQIRNVEKRHGVKVVLAGLNAKVQEALFNPPDDALENEFYPSVDAAVQAADEFVMEANGALAKYRPFPAASAARGSVEVSENTVGFIALVSHGDRTPKQKLRAELDAGEGFYQFIFGGGEGGTADALKVAVESRRQRSQLEWHLSSSGGAGLAGGSRAAASAAAGTGTTYFRSPTEAALHRVLTVLEPSELSVVVKRSEVGGPAQIVAKWGGMLTEVGLKQAAATGAVLHARLGLDSMTDRPLTVSSISNGEQRVTDTGRGLLDGFLRLHEHEQFCTVEERKDFDAPAKPVLEFQDTIERRAAELLTIRTRQEAILHAHVPGMPALLAAVKPEGPRAALVRTAELLESLIVNVRERAMSGSVFNNAETPKALAARYAFVLARLTRQPTEALAADEDSGSATTVEASVDYEKAEFNATMIKAVYDNVTYDIVQNALQLALECTVDLRPLFVIVQKMYTVVSLTQHGSNPSERLVYSAMRSAGFLRRMSAAIHAQVASRKERVAAAKEAAEAAAASGTTGQEGEGVPAVPLHLDFFFSSAALLSALRGCVANSDVVKRHSRGARSALRELEKSGLHFFSHAVVKIVHGGEGETEEAMLEMYFSSGAAIRPEAVDDLAVKLETERQIALLRKKKITSSASSALQHSPEMPRGADPLKGTPGLRGVFSEPTIPRHDADTFAPPPVSPRQSGSSFVNTTPRGHPTPSSVGKPTPVLAGFPPSVNPLDPDVLEVSDVVEDDAPGDSAPVEPKSVETAGEMELVPVAAPTRKSKLRIFVQKLNVVLKACRSLNKAARSLTKVQPLLRVWRLSLAEFDEMVQEMEDIVGEQQQPTS